MPGLLEQAEAARQRAQQINLQPAAQPTAQVGPEQSAVPPEAQQPLPQQPAPAPEVVAPEAPPAVNEEPVTPEGPGYRGHEASETEQGEYERALSALYKVLYEDKKTSGAIIQGLESTPENKIEPIAKMSTLLINQLDEAVDLDESVVAQITGDAVDRLIEIAETRYKAEYSDVEAQRAMGATWEAVMMMFGVEEDDFAQFTQGMSQEDIMRGKEVYTGALGKNPEEGGMNNG